MEITSIFICVKSLQESAGVETEFISFDMDCYTYIIITNN